MTNGIITQIIGPVVDVYFPDGDVPPIYTALTVKNSQGETVTLEVEQHISGGEVRTVALFSTDGLVRGSEVVSTGSPISVPVGDGSLGRLLNVLGEPIDGKGAVTVKERMSIHRKAPLFKEQ